MINDKEIQIENPMEDLHADNPTKQWRALALVHLEITQSPMWSFKTDDQRTDIVDGLNAWSETLLYYERMQEVRVEG